MIRHDLTKEEVCQFLYSFQLRPNRPGFFYTIQAVLLVSSLPDEIDFPEQDLYRKLAALYHVSEETVKHDLRATLVKIWRLHPERVSRLAGQQFSRIPPTLVFLRLLASAPPA